MNKIEIKAINKELALEIAKDQYGFSGEMEVIELQVPRNILGFIKKRGLYSVAMKEVVKESNENLKVKVKEEVKVVKKQEKKSEIEEKITNLIKLMDLKLDFTIEKKRDRVYYINFNGEDNGIAIGKKGKTLNSLEYLLNAMIKECKIELDVEGFREKRDVTLRELGDKMARKVIATKKAVKLNPMPPRERKKIHEVLNTYKELDTYSEGKDPKRYIVIRLRKDDKNNI